MVAQADSVQTTKTIEGTKAAFLLRALDVWDLVDSENAGHRLTADLFKVSCKQPQTKDVLEVPVTVCKISNGEGKEIQITTDLKLSDNLWDKEHRKVQALRDIWMALAEATKNKTIKKTTRGEYLKVEKVSCEKIGMEEDGIIPDYTCSITY
jgi:hypothetical protein